MFGLEGALRLSYLLAEVHGSIPVMLFTQNAAFLLHGPNRIQIQLPAHPSRPKR